MKHTLYISIISLLGILTFLSSCGGEAEYNVAPVFDVYVQRYIDQAAARGTVIDFTETGLSIEFRDAVDKESGGVCKGNHTIEIEKFFWDGLSDSDKEGLIFHELGHCDLLRPHRNDKLANGEWASRMRGSPIPDGDNAVINYSGTRRLYYIDELFDENTPFPDWASWSMQYDEVPEEDKVELLNVTDVTEFNENVIGLDDGNFEIEILLNVGTSEGFVGMQVLGVNNDDRIRIIYSRDDEFAIDSGTAVWGLMHFRENDDRLITAGNNKLTLRRIGDVYWVFVNEQFAYWFDYIRPTRNSITSLDTGRLGMPEYLSVKAYRIP